jgi:NAD(P)-dependent dehydrogenase (short-subunit alcohol dehydrogenase family)
MPFPEQQQNVPGVQAQMDPVPDCGEESYTGSGKLTGKTAIITGGDSGIGRAVAIAYAREGADVLIAYLNEDEDARDVARYVEEAGRKCVLVGGDLSDPQHCRAVVDRAVSEFGKIDVLVNNAALFAPLQEQEFTDIDVELWDRVMAVNVRGPFLMTKHVVPHMKERGYGKIINIGSGTAFRGIPWMLHYVTSKGAVVSFTRALSRELGEHGIRVNTLSPGFTMSDTVVAESPGHVATARARAVAARALKRDEYPEDLLGALVFSPRPKATSSPGRTSRSTAEW